MTKRGFVGHLWIVAAAVVFLSAPLLAQFRSSIEGTVSDPSGAVVAGVQIVLTNTETGVSQTTQSSAEGSYHFPSLPPGSYKLTATKPGFQTLIQENVSLLAQETRTVPLVMKVGQIQETVTVTAENAPIQFSEAKVASDISARELHELPLAGRNILNLLTVTPGVTGVGTAGANAGGTDVFSLVNNPFANANGQRGDGNAFYVDNSLATSNPDPGAFNLTPNPDSIEELHISVNDYSAESGRSGSLVIQAVTKAGTNNLHGSLFEYHQDNALTALNPVIRRLPGSKITPFRRNEFGGSVGGPVQKDKWFFFFSWDQKKSSSPTVLSDFIEHPDFVTFMQATYPNTIAYKVMSSFPPSAPNGIDPATIQTVNDLYYQEDTSTGVRTPLCPTSGPPVAGMLCTLNIRGRTTNQYVLPDNGLQWNARIDRYFGGKDRVYGNFFRKTPDSFSPAIRPAFNVRNNFAGITNYANLDWTHTFSPTVVNDAAFGVTRISGLGACSHCEIPVIGTDITGFGAFFAPAEFIQNDFHWRDVLSISRGKHALKMGADIFRDQENDLFNGPYQRPAYFFSDTNVSAGANLNNHTDQIFDFAQDLPNTEANINYNLQTGALSRQSIGFRSTNFGFFGQDDIKLMSNLSVNAGLRWDFNSNPNEQSGQMTNLVLGSGSTLEQQISGASLVVRPTLLAKHRIGYFAPRLSFAWDPTKKGKLSIRGGMGVFFNRAPNIVWSDAIRGNPPFIAGIGVNRGGSGPQPVYGLCAQDHFPFGCLIPSGLPTGLNPRGGAICDNTTDTGSGCSAIGGTDPGLRQAYNISRFFGVQYGPSSSWLFEADYVGSHDVHLYVFTNRNRCVGCMDLNPSSPTFQQPLRPNPYFNDINYTNNDAWSYSNGATFSALHRFSHSFTFQAAFNIYRTISLVDSIDVGRASSEATVYDPYNLAAQKGPAAFNVPKSFSMHGVWELPKLEGMNRLVRSVLGGWQWSGAVSLQDGYPFTLVDCSVTADGFTGPCPIANINPSLRGKKCSSSQFLNGGCLDASQVNSLSNGQEGNAGRNTFNGPGFANVDFSTAKYFPIPWFTGKEGAKLQIRGEFFNLFNRTNLNSPDGNVQDKSCPSPGNCVIGGATNAYFPRTIQVGARIEF
jgi:hypothetical protein